MELILKKNLQHQTEPIEKLGSIFINGVYKPRKGIENPIIDINTPYLHQAIKNFQAELPSNLQGTGQDNKSYLNIDIKMETGTGKTYVYTKSIYELNKLYGFKKFIIVVPSLAIKAGTENFIKNQNNINHFKNVCQYNGEIKLQTIEGSKRKKGAKNYMPGGIREFVTSSSAQKNTIEVLLVNMQHLRESKTGILVRDDYDSHIEGFYKPIDAIAATRPIVIIDEPHRFNRDNVTFKFIEEQIKPQMIVRFGATFPKKIIGKGKNRVEVKDYQNLIHDLNIHKSFEQNLIKGVAKEHVESPNQKEEVFKILALKKGEYVKFQKTTLNEKNKPVKTTKELKPHDSLSLLSSSLQGITIDGILATKIILSNGEEKVNGDTFFADVFATSYVRESIQLALKRHFETERENFNRKFKIKTLALFFIDDIFSYRDNDEKEPYLKNIFEEELQKKVKQEIANCTDADITYKAYLEETERNIKNTHAGYFSQDNVSTEAEIEKEVNKILYEKEKLLSLTDEKGNYNTTRFIFSKWTLKEGWDNPNIFTIAKLRSSGSDNSKLQEIGRGLRLPVDETGNRIENESFTLNYIVDFTEKDFVNSLEKEIYGESSNTFTELSSEQIEILAAAKDITKEELVTELMIKGYISYNLKIKQEKLEDLGREYPEFFNKVDKKRIIDRNKEKDKKVRIRKENYWKIKELWEQLNQKYYLYFDDIEESILINTVSSVVKDDLIGKTVRTAERNTMEMVQGELFFNTTYETIEDMGNSNIPYGIFLKKVAERTNISIPIIHKGFVQASKSKKIESAFFTLDTVKSFELYFKQRIYNEMLKIFSYKKLPNARVHPTQLTMNDGSPREFIQTSAYLGIKESSGTPLDTYLYDKVLWDSDIEENNIRKNIESVEVFGKIPRRTLKIPFIDGSTYSPDFMYIIKDQLNNTKLNLVIESKGIEKNKDLRFTEQDKIDSATKLYEVMKKEGIEVKFRTQTNNENIVTIINDLLDK